MTDGPTIIEGEARDVTPASSAVAIRQESVLQTKGTIFDIGEMTDVEFAHHAQVVKSGVKRIAQLQRDLLEEGPDYGPIPGTDQKRKVLLKPGAEKLAMFYRLVPEFTSTLVATPQPSGIDRLDVTVRNLMHYGSHDGPIVGEGTGVCSSWEARYRWRNAMPLCPQCGKDLRFSKDKPEVYCWTKLGGCGFTAPKDDPRVVTQSVGRIENPEPYDLLNTITKIAEKRSHVDGVIRTLGASALFTQDEDAPGMQPDGPPDAQEPRSASRSTPAASTSTPAPKEGPGTFTGKVNEAPDGVRQLTDGTPKLEIRFKVGTSQHTAIVLGPLARATWETGLVVVGATVGIKGVLVLQAWGDPKDNKPRKKVVEQVERVAIGITGPDGHGAWHVVEPLTLPLETPENRRGAERDPTPSTPSAPSAPPPEPATGPSSATIEEAEPPEDPTMTGPPQQASRMSSGTTDDILNDEDLFDEARAVFDPMTLPVYSGHDDEPFEQRVGVITFDLTPTKRRHFWASAHDLEGGRCRVEVLAQPGTGLVAGETVHVAGMWRQVRDGMVLAASEVTA